MRKHLLFFLLFIGFSAFGQLEVSPDPVNLVTDAAVHDAVVDISLKNTGSDSITVWWRLNVDGAPSEWEYQICDCNLCYLPGLLSTPCAQPCTLAPGENFIFMVHVLTHGHAAESNIMLDILPECDGETPLNQVPIGVIVNGSSSTENESIDNKISLFPNPASNIFKIKDDKQISQIALYNIVGKKIRTESHRAGQTHDISDLNRGIYLVRMIDDSQNIVKVLRLTKE